MSAPVGTIRAVSAPRPVHANRTGVALTALSAAFFGSLAVYGKFADRMGITTTELLAVRFGVAAAILWAVAVARRERVWWGRRTLGLAVMGLLYVGQAAAYFTSLKTVPAAVTSILLYLYPGDRHGARRTVPRRTAHPRARRLRCSWPVPACSPSSTR